MAIFILYIDRKEAQKDTMTIKVMIDENDSHKQNKTFKNKYIDTYFGIYIYESSICTM